jgi:hypothetical protein
VLHEPARQWTDILGKILLDLIEHIIVEPG